MLLATQDRTAWDHAAITRADRLLVTASDLRRPGRFQLQGAIAACHALAPTWADTDWLQIVTLYDLLLRTDPSPVVALNQAIALSHLHGPAHALAQVDRLADRLADYHLLHATRADLLDRLGRAGEAREANRRALPLAATRSSGSCCARGWATGRTDRTDRTMT